MDFSDPEAGPNQELLLTYKETQEALRIGPTMFFELKNAGEFEVVAFGKAKRITARSVRALVQRRMHVAQAA